MTTPIGGPAIPDDSINIKPGTLKFLRNYSFTLGGKPYKISQISLKPDPGSTGSKISGHDVFDIVKAINAAALLQDKDAQIKAVRDLNGDITPNFEGHPVNNIWLEIMTDSGPLGATLQLDEAAEKDDKLAGAERDAKAKTEAKTETKPKAPQRTAYTFDNRPTKASELDAEAARLRKELGIPEDEADQKTEDEKAPPGSGSPPTRVEE